jgi:hypothetical protein
MRRKCVGRCSWLNDTGNYASSRIYEVQKQPDRVGVDIETVVWRILAFGKREAYVEQDIHILKKLLLAWQNRLRNKDSDDNRIVESNYC